MKKRKRSEGVMNPKITLDHLGRGAVVYVRQSSMGQVAENTESRRRQYALAESARTMGFASVAIIDDDLGRSGSGVAANHPSDVRRSRWADDDPSARTVFDRAF